MKHKIAVVTATRAEYGILKPLIRKLQENNKFELQLIVTGSHLLETAGNTVKEIEADGYSIARKIPIHVEAEGMLGVSYTAARALEQFATYFWEEHPEWVVVLGDRTELLGICSAAVCSKIPIIHLHGGEVTEGAVDEMVRHAVTKMSFLQFVANEEYACRVIQMGEQPDRGFNVGALGMKRYLSAVKYASMVLGNSSSGIIEAPALATPTVNIGNRQKGRLMAESVLSCESRVDDILEKMKKAERMMRKESNLYGDGNTSAKIVDIIEKFAEENRLAFSKKFNDIKVK